MWRPAGWYHPAAEQGYVKAQFNLGLMHGKGQGVHQNYVEAHMWFGLTAAQAPADVRDRYVNVRDGVAQEMTREIRRPSRATSRPSSTSD